MSHQFGWLGMAAWAAPLACAHPDLPSERRALASWAPAPASAPARSTGSDSAPSEPGSDASRLGPRGVTGGLSSFVAQALRHAPHLQAAHAEWRAAVHAAGSSGRLPEPELTYSGFVQAVETRVGPQQHRISLKQAVPWPGGLAASSRAAAASASAAREAFLAQVLEVVRDVARAYWSLWRVERSHQIRLNHEQVLQGLVATVQARVETGEKSIADLLQVQLRLQAHRDHRTRHRAELRRLQASLLTAVGAEPHLTVQTHPESPKEALPAVPLSALREATRRHPLLCRWEDEGRSRQAELQVARSQRLPDLRAGADYMVTGPAPNPGLPDSGKDPVILSLGLSVPVWVRSYREEIASAEARASAADAQRRQAWLQLSAELEETVATLQESHERIGRYRGTLIPQAESLQRSVSAAYEVGRAGVSEVMLALEQELELRLQLAEVQAQHAVAWAELDRLTGQALTPHEEETQP